MYSCSTILKIALLAIENQRRGMMGAKWLDFCENPMILEKLPKVSGTS